MIDTTADSDSDVGSDETAATLTSSPSAGTLDATTGAADTTSGGGPAVLCSDDAGMTPLAVLRRDDRSVVLRADTTMLDLDFATAPADAQDVTTELSARDEWIAVTRTFSLDSSRHGVVALLTAQGDQVWLRSEDNGLSVPHVGADASVVAFREFSNSAKEGALYTSATSAQALPGMQLAGPPRDDGWVPGSRLSGSEPTAWIDSLTLVIQDASYYPYSPRYLRDDGAIFYLTAIDDVTTLVREDPASVELASLPLVPTVIYGGMASSDQRWLLIYEGEPTTWYRVAVEAGTAELLDLTPPDGTTPLLPCTGPNTVIDDQGRIVIAVRDASVASVRRFDPTTGVWDVIGEPVTAVDGIVVAAWGESYVLESLAQGTTYCPLLRFEAAGDALAGTLFQVVRPIDAKAHVIEPEVGTPVLRRDGRCMAVIGPDVTTVIDLVDDVQLDVTGVREVFWWSD